MRVPVYSLSKNEFEIVGNGTARVILTQGKVTLIDVETIPIVSPYRWFAARGKGSLFYAVTAIGLGNAKRHLPMHRFLLDAPKGVLADHRNGDSLDNRISNIRLATHSQNGMNRGIGPANTSGYKGVSWSRLAGKWIATIQSEYNAIRLGAFGTPEDAARAYDDAARYLHGQFARLNFPEGDEYGV